MSSQALGVEAERAPLWRWLVPAAAAFAIVLVVRRQRPCAPRTRTRTRTSSSSTRATSPAATASCTGPAGPPAEGATDFLWLVFVAALNAVGFDVALAACIGNALRRGAARLRRAQARRARRRLAAPGVDAAPFLISGAAFAAYLGFSALLYCALAALLFQHHVHALVQPSGARAIPWLALVLALFRPDGVLLAAGFVALVSSRRAREHARPVPCSSSSRRCRRRALLRVALEATSACRAPAALRQGARRGRALRVGTLRGSPTRVLPGLEANLAWLGQQRRSSALARWAATASGSPDARRARRSSARGILARPHARLLLLLGLCFARQTQNIGARYQAPVDALALVALVALAAQRARSRVVERGRHGRGIVLRRRRFPDRHDATCADLNRVCEPARLRRLRSACASAASSPPSACSR
jgi:hypothetical protein